MTTITKVVYFENIVVYYGNIVVYFGNIVVYYGNIVVYFGNIVVYYGNIVVYFGEIVNFQRYGLTMTHSTKNYLAINHSNFDRALICLGRILWHSII